MRAGDRRIDPPRVAAGRPAGKFIDFLRCSRCGRVPIGRSAGVRAVQVPVADDRAHPSRSVLRVEREPADRALPALVVAVQQLDVEDLLLTDRLYESIIQWIG